jgi:hypothetical protein
MSRGLTAAMVTELAAGRVRLVYFVEAEFSSGTINVWSGANTISWDSKTWTGLGQFGGLSPVVETSSVRAENLILSLSGIPSDLVTKALDEVRYGKPATVWLGFLNEDDTVIADPTKSFEGQIDKADLEEGAESAVIRVNVESRLASLQRANERRMTPDDQKKRHATDQGFDFVSAIQEAQLVWGKGSPVSSGRQPGADNSGPRFDRRKFR